MLLNHSILTKKIKPFIIIYIICLFLATFFIVPTLTSFYYYAWGKHLAWSYFDGPPMIAYFFSISHAIFGNTFFSINIVGLACYIAAAYYVYKIGCLLHDQNTGLISALIWAVLPTTTESVFIRVLYDAPLNLFTILSFYYFVRYVSLKRVSDLYLTAFFIGTMILSKYTAAVSMISLFLYITFSKQRALFKSWNFYCAILLVILMTTPIIYWNANHDWISVTYLFHFHTKTPNTPIHSILEWTSKVLLNFSVFFLLAAWGGYNYITNKKKTRNSLLELTYAILLIELVFWFIVVLLGGDLRAIYLTPLGMNFALVSGYTIIQYQYFRFFKIIYPLFLILSFGMILVNSWPIAAYLNKGKVYSGVKQILRKSEIIKKGHPLVTGFYTNAAVLNFFMPQNSVHAIPCDDINQYHYWSESFLNDLSKGSIDKILFINFENSNQCAEKYFNKCDIVATIRQQTTIPVINKDTKPVYLYAYECSLPRK